MSLARSTEPDEELQSLLERVRNRERAALKRTVAYSLIPIIIAVIVLGVVSWQIKATNQQLMITESRLDNANQQAQVVNREVENAKNQLAAIRDNCLAQFFEELPENTVEVGASGVDVRKRDERAVIKFTEDRNTIGAIKLNFFPENQFFKIEEMVGLNCQTITEYRNVTRGGDKNILQNYDVLEFTVENSTYRLRIGDRGVVIRVGFSKVP